MVFFCKKWDWLDKAKCLKEAFSLDSYFPILQIKGETKKQDERRQLDQWKNKIIRTNNNILKVIIP